MLDIEQKMAALNALTRCALHQRKPGDWYLSAPGVEIKKGPILGSVGGDGSGPFEAIADAWQNATILGPGEYIVTCASKEDRQAFKWNGFMWATVDEEDAA